MLYVMLWYDMVWYDEWYSTRLIAVVWNSNAIVWDFNAMRCQRYAMLWCML